MTGVATTLSGPRVVAIGGGHGLAMSLRAIQTYAGRLTAVVATTDDGGSSGRLRSERSIPALGDLRRCLTALADQPTLAAGLEHRFDGGALDGHAVGNLLLAGLIDSGLDLTSAADVVAGCLGVDADRASVLPATEGSVTLVSTTDDGREVKGQVASESCSGVQQIRFEPPDPEVPAKVLSSIETADQIVVGPGSFFTSVLAAVAVPAIAKAVSAAAARVVLIANLRGEGDGLSTIGEQLDRLVGHGVRVDDVVVQRGALPIGDVGDVELIEADVVRPHGLAHDPVRLAAVLARRVS